MGYASSLRLVALIVLQGAGSAVHAEPPTAPYAAAQLQVARSELEEAEAALAAQEYALARRLAAQAHLDARLAWGMTDSAFVRRDALELAGMVDRLRSRVVSAGAGNGSPP